MDFFKDTHKITDFFKGGQEFIYRKGEIILRDGDTPSGVYYIENGFVKAYSINIDATQLLITTTIFIIF